VVEFGDQRLCEVSWLDFTVVDFLLHDGVNYIILGCASDYL
jgi:hypothetical protein